MDEWFSASELESFQLPGLPSRRAGITRRAQAEGWPSRARQGRGGGSGFFALPALSLGMIFS